ncbi:protein PF14_0175-like isoform X2 [Melanaphis sacchari]|uniref:protein PF14_0175-like isoform X2 n=1 Tax=Melanaphis sacchari TaxID=742174 RepID=UPI000DC12F75|nr:protein PF14_0175-like isoform X2 [Melanaphis sacchari]
MDNPEAIENSMCETPQQQLLPIENNCLPVENALLNNDCTDPSKIVGEISNSESQVLKESIDENSQNTNVTTEPSSVVSTDNSMPPLPPLPKNDNGQLPQPPAAPLPADYNMQNYANYNNYMYNYNNYYGYPYPQYQWDYNSQQYYQPYQNYYNYNFNQANQTQTSKPPPPPPNSVQLPVEEKPANKTNITVDESNRYSPTAETDDDGLTENLKADILIEQSSQTINAAVFQTAPSEQIEVQQNIPESINNTIQQTIDPSTLPLITSVQQSVPIIAQIQPYNIQIQQPSYPINPQSQMQSTETFNEAINQQKNSPALNGKDDSIEKVSKASTVLGKSQAKKRLMAFSMMKQKLQEQNNSITDNQSSDIGEGNDAEFVPEHNVFQTVTKKKVVTNKKVAKVIKAQQTIEQIEEMKKDELLQGNNAALYQHLLRSGGNEAPILQKLGIESLAEKYSAKIREQDKRSSKHHHRRRDESRRGHKYRRRSRSKSRTRSRSTEKPKMRALEVKSWKDFVKGGFHFDKFRRFKMDEAEEIKEKERKSRKKKRHGDSRSDSKNHKNESNIPSETEKGTGDQKIRYNILDRKKEILKGLEVNTHEGDFTKDFPSYIIRYTKNKPVIKFSENPANATYHLQNRQQMFATLLPEIEAIVLKFLSSIKPKKLKKNYTDNNYNNIDEKLLIMMKDKNIYPFKGWWPKTNFIVTQVKEDPNIEIDEDVLMNEMTTSKRTKKSRFNDDSSFVDLRPTVPSKWDSDYDGSPAAENKISYVGVSQSVEMNTNDNVCIIERDKKNPLDISHQEEAMDTASDVGEDEPKIEVNICPVQPIQIQEPQGNAKLNTEYEEFLKIVKVEKEESENSITATTNNVPFQKDNDNNLSTKSVSLNDNSIQDDSEDYMSTKSSDESVSLHNAAEESDSNSGSFVEEVSSNIDLKVRKRKKSSSKKSKTFKNKESKKRRHKSSSSESSQDSESESDSSSDDSDSESTDSSSTIEKKKKNKSKNKKKKKTKTSYKKKHRGDKNKTKSPEEEKDTNSSILNLIEKALNVEIKKRPLDSKEQKKKKKKHEKKENKSNEENDEKFEKVKDCLKETITKLVKTDKVNKNQSLSCDETVIEVLKYLNDKEKKNKKSKKSSKRKHDSDISDDEKTLKKSKLVDSCSKPKVNDKKKKSKKKKSVERKSVDSDEYLTKKKSKKRSKSTDTSEAEDVEGLSQNKNDTVQFFELRPNEWNINKKSSMRGVIHHSEAKNKDKVSLLQDTERCDKNVKKKSDHINLDNCSPTNRSTNKIEVLNLPNVLYSVGEKEKRKTHLQKTNEDIKSDKIDNVSKNKNSDSKSNEEENDKMLKKSVDKCHNDVFKLKNDIQQTVFLEKDNSEQHDVDKDLKSIFKPQIQSTPLDLYNKPPITCSVIKPVKEPISYRDKVKMNLKKLSTCQNMPFVFGFSSPINLIGSKKFNLDKTTDFKVTNEEDKSKDEPIVDNPIVNETKLLNPDEPIVDNPIVNETKLLNPDEPIVDNPTVNETKLLSPDKPIEDNPIVNKTKLLYPDEPIVDNPIVNETKLLNPDEPKVIPQTRMEKPHLTIAEKESPKINIDTDIKSVDHSYDWDDSEESDTDQSLTTSTNSSEHSSDDRESEQIHSNSLVNDSPNRCIKYETFSNDSNVKDPEEFTSNVFETNSLDSRSEEQGLPLEVDNVSIKKELTSLSNLADFSEQHLDSNTVDLQNNLSSIDVLEVSDSSNELITQWTSDWTSLNKSITEINHPSYSKFGDEELQLKKKSRWDKQSMDNKISRSQSPNNEIEECKDETEANILTNEQKNVSSLSNNDDDLYNEQIQTCEIMSINCMNDIHEINPSAYDDYTQTYEQYTGIPTYSEMKTIEHDLLSPIDYSVYENYNPNYSYHTEDYNMWKSLDTDISEHEVIKAIPTTDESFSQYEKHMEVPSFNISVDQVEFSKREVSNNNNIIISDIPDNQDKIVNSEKSDSASSDKLFVELYHQHFQHYNQNPIKYSLSNPVTINSEEVNIPESLISQEKLSETDQNSDNILPIPLQTRAYSCILEDANTNLYLTSDNYMAYCAVEDKCMVHISVNPCNREGVGVDVRHCFNINISGSINEYWLHADLIPFYIPSDAESGVFSDDEVDSLESDSGHEEDVNIDNNENDDDIIESEWEIVDDIHDNVNSWLDEPYILKKYSIEHDINEEHCVTSSSDCDTDGSEFSDSYLDIFNDNHKYKNASNKVMPINVFEKTESFATNLDLLVETKSEQLVMDFEIKKENDTLENDQTSEINMENNCNILIELEEKVNSGNESGIMKEEVTVKELSMLDTIINQKLLIQKLKIRAKEKICEKLPDTVMVRYSDNMETIKHPFLGLFQPPTNSILSKPKYIQPSYTTNLSKRVTFADGIHPGDNLAASPTHDDIGCPLSPPPLKALMRETLKFKRNMYPFKKSKLRTKLKMEKKKVAKVTPSIKTTNPSIIEYYVSRQRLADIPIDETLKNVILRCDFSSNNDNNRTERNSTPPRPTRELTPVPSDTECWNDEEVVKNSRQ